MKTLDNVILARSIETCTNGEVLTIDATLFADHDNVIFQGHFPSRPITPGIVLISIVVELIERFIECPVNLYDVKKTKCLRMMTPDDVDGATLHIELSNNGVVNAHYKKGDIVYSKITLLLTDENLRYYTNIQ